MGPINPSMESPLQERILKLKEKLNAHGSVTHVRRTVASNIVKKLKYKPKDYVTKRNPFLSDKLQKSRVIYENTLESAGLRFPGFDLYSSVKFLARVKRLVEDTQCISLNWDEEWINPVTVTSKGWEYFPDDSVAHSTLPLQCSCCRKLLYLDLQEPEVGQQSDLFNKAYHESLSSEHSKDCLWKYKQFDSTKNYYLNETNLTADVYRILDGLKNGITPSSNLEPDANLNKIAALFQVRETSKLQLLRILLQGYELIDKDIVQCTKCFRRTFTKSLNEGHNGHTSWCSYSDPSKLSNLLLTLYDKKGKTEGSIDLRGRIKALEFTLKKYN